MSAVPIDAPNVTNMAVHTLYREHHGWLQSWLRKRLDNASDAADLAQDTFLRILAAWDRPGLDEGAMSREDHLDDRDVGKLALREPRAYLTTVARRIVANHYRRLSLERAYLDALACLPEASVPSSEDRLIVLETLHAIDAMLERLAPTVRLAFLLAQLDGLTYAEIAERLQVSVRTVKRYMALAYEACLMLPA